MSRNSAPAVRYVEAHPATLARVVEAARKARHTLSHGLGCPSFMNERTCTCGVRELREALEALDADCGGGRASEV